MNGRRRKHIEKLVVPIVNLEHAGEISDAIAIVGRRPHGRKLVVEQHLVALHAQLVRAQNAVESVPRAEAIDHVVAESKARASVADKIKRGQGEEWTW